MTIYLLETEPISAEQLDSMAQALPTVRRDHAEKIKNLSVKRESITAAYLTLYALMMGDPDQGLCHPDLYELLYHRKRIGNFASAVGWPVNEQGKPFADGLPGTNGTLFVNLSHSNGVVAVAVAREPLGIDVQSMPVSKPEQLLRIASKFHPDERQQLENLSAEELRPAFCRLWACKESVMKLCGKGLSLLLSSFSIQENTCELDGHLIRLYVQHTQTAYISVAVWDNSQAKKETAYVLFIRNRIQTGYCGFVCRRPVFLLWQTSYHDHNQEL